MTSPLKALEAQLDVEPLEQNLFRGQSSDFASSRVFGGQVVSQALVAASRTVEGRPPHSLHAYFLLPGDVKAPIVYEVERIRDGKSFSARRVQAIQHGQPILSMIASFQTQEQGLEHQLPMPQVPPPEALPPFAETVDAWLAESPGVHPKIAAALRGPNAIDFRPVHSRNPFKAVVGKAEQAIWFRASEAVQGDALLHTCLLAYASDFNLIATALLPHGVSWFSGDVVLASLDHALWFHRPVRMDDWLLYSMDSPSAQGARGLTRGLIHDRSGRLVASVAQEGLMRPVEPATPGAN